PTALLYSIYLLFHGEPSGSVRCQKTMGFREVLDKSFCRPIEQHVNVETEFPGGVEDFYIPHCVSLFRCSGCCIDETRECYPVVERNITLEVRSDHGRFQTQSITLKSSTHHASCEPSGKRFRSRVDSKLNWSLQQSEFK
uniref:Platelet-derived growth factor (PDGF) family profile domain-containing protein n=1 Tax=Xiphophorus couchianus TaxID=32473 RepID=A0A3B5LJM8_9TELE